MLCQGYNRQEKRIGQALDVSRQTIEGIREIFKDLPQERRMPYEEALLKAEQALQGRDPRVVAEAMQALQQRIREITAKGA